LVGFLFIVYLEYSLFVSFDLLKTHSFATTDVGRVKKTQCAYR